MEQVLRIESNGLRKDGACWRANVKPTPVFVAFGRSK
jgi:hypothetical protein